MPGSVLLRKQTWDVHIQQGHPDVDYQHVASTMRDPCYICESATVEGDLVLVSEQNTNQHGDALRLPVTPEEGNYIVKTAYYSAASSHGAVVWSRGDE